MGDGFFCCMDSSVQTQARVVRYSMLSTCLVLARKNNNKNRNKRDEKEEEYYEEEGEKTMSCRMMRGCVSHVARRF